MITTIIDNHGIIGTTRQIPSIGIICDGQFDSKNNIYLQIISTKFHWLPHRFNVLLFMICSTSTKYDGHGDAENMQI
jgi:hypothetical protein